jgi:hypothetical protein
MSYRKLIARELEVAFSKNAQPVGWRVAKYLILGTVLYLYWNTPTLWWLLGIGFGLGLLLHFWYRYRTKAWTQSFGGWDYEKNKPGSSTDKT